MRQAKHYERLPETVAGLHFVAFACLRNRAAHAKERSTIHRRVIV